MQRMVGESREDGPDGLVDPVRRALQRGRDRPALGVEQDRIFRGGREHTAFLEADDKEMRAARVAGLLEAAHVEMSWTRTLRGHAQRLDPFADEAQRFLQRT